MWFAAIIGLKINVEVSFLLSICSFRSLLSITSWHSGEKKLHKMLAMWKRQHLSKRMEHSCQKALCQVHIFIISLFLLLRRVSLNIKNTKTDFLSVRHF